MSLSLDLSPQTNVIMILVQLNLESREDVWGTHGADVWRADG